MIDKLLANKPHDRYQTAGEAAEALQALLKPKRSATPQARAVAPPVEVSPAPSPVVVEVDTQPPRPEVIAIAAVYPGWFRPYAALAERSPGLALTALGMSTAGAIAIGFAIGWFARG